MKAPIVVIGDGGHAKVVIEVLESTGEFEIRGCTAAPGRQGELHGYPILGADDLLPGLLRSGVTHAFVALGSNAERKRMLAVVRAIGFQVPNAISPRAIVSPRARFGSGVLVMPGAIVNADAAIGDGCIINSGCVVEHDCVLGECVHVAPGAVLAGGVIAGDGAFLGAGCVVIERVRVGGWAFVGAGAAVVGAIEDAATVAGVPARPLPCPTANREPKS